MSERQGMVAQATAAYEGSFCEKLGGGVVAQADAAYRLFSSGEKPFLCRPAERHAGGVSLAF